MAFFFKSKERNSTDALGLDFNACTFLLTAADFVFSQNMDLAKNLTYNLRGKYLQRTYALVTTTIYYVLTGQSMKS